MINSDSVSQDKDNCGERSNRKLANEHYENFSVASFFIPKRLRQDLYNVYAYCRLADDIADESGSKADALSALDDWERLLEASVAGQPVPPLFEALGATIRRHNLSLDPFRDLLKAFRLDIVKTRWADWNDLRDYTRYSADPVGRIVLELFGYRIQELNTLSDNICTALQLANHWQDVREDWKRGRIYIPQCDLERFEVTEDDIASRRFSDRFQRLMTYEVQRARQMFQEGKALINLVSKPFDVQLYMYYRGGMAALDAVERINYDVLNHPAKVGWQGKMTIACGVLYRWMRLWR